MDSDLSLEFLRVVEQAAIACAHTMGQGDRHNSDHVAVEAMRQVMDTVPIDGTIVIGEGERDEAPMLYIGEKVGLPYAGAATARRRRATPRWTSPSIRSRAPTCARPARPTPSPCSPLPSAAACCTRPISTWRSSSSGRARRMSSTSTRRSRTTWRRLQSARPQGRGPGGRRPRSRAARPFDPRHPCDRRAHPPHRRRRPVGRHRRGGRRLGSPCRHGHRRRARGVLLRGGDALSQRRDLRPPRRQQARARRALPPDGNHRFQASTAPTIWRRAGKSSSPLPASPTAR